MSLVPVTLAATTKAPVVTVPEKVSIRELIGYVPTGVVGSFMGGAASGILFALGAVYATAIGLSIGRTAFFLIAPMIGAIVLQWPIGRLSDKVSRRTVILGVAIVASAICATLMLIPVQSELVPILMLGLGGTMFPLYSLVVSYTLDWTPEGKTVGAAGTLIRINGSGALAGPLVAAGLMSAFGPRWFFWTLTIAFGVIVVYVAWRMLVKDAMPMERQKQFVPFPARAGSAAMHLVAKPVRSVTKITAKKRAASRRHSLDVARHPSSTDSATASEQNTPAGGAPTP